MAIIPVLTKNGSQQNKATYTSSNIIPVLTKNTVTKTPTVTKSPTPTKPISQPTTSLIKKTNIAPVDNIIAKVSKEPKIGQIFEGFKNIVGQVEQSTKSYIKSAKEEPVSFTKGAVEQFGTDLAVTLTRVAGSVQKNIASQPALGIAGQGLSFKFPDRWDISKQSDAYKKQVENVLKNSPISEQRGANVGKFISDAYQFAVAGEITGATVGTKILVPTAERYLPKAIKLIPAINNVIGFTGLGQLQYDKTQDSSRIDKLKSDIIMAGLFEAIPILSKGLTKGTKESISKLVGKTAKDLKSPTGAEIDALEKEITTVKDAIENDTGKKAEVIFTQNVAKASDQQLKEVSAKELGFKEGENKVTKISIDKIDSGLSPLMKDKKLNVDSMIDTLKKGEDLPAIPVYKDGEKFILNSDGNRRYQAYKQAGIKEVPVKIEAKTSMTPLAKNNAERKIVADDGEAGLYDADKVKQFLKSSNYDKLSQQEQNKLNNLVYSLRNFNGNVENILNPSEKKFIDQLRRNYPEFDNRPQILRNETINPVNNNLVWKGVKTGRSTEPSGLPQSSTRSIIITNGLPDGGIDTSINLSLKHEPIITQVDKELGKAIFAGKPEALKLSKDEFVSKGLAYYKTTPEYKNAPAGDKGWYELTTKNDLERYYREVNPRLPQQPTSTAGLYDTKKGSLFKEAGTYVSTKELKMSPKKQIDLVASGKKPAYAEDYITIADARNNLKYAKDKGLLVGYDKYKRAYVAKTQEALNRVIASGNKGAGIGVKLNPTVEREHGLALGFRDIRVAQQPIADAKIATQKSIQSKPSGVAKQIESKAVEKGLIDKGYNELAQYDSSTIKEQAKLASKYSIEDMNKIASGEIPLPKELKPGTPLSIAEDYAIKNGDTELLQKLAKSPLATQISESASELSLSRMRDTNSPVKIMKDIINIRKKAFESKFKEKSVDQVVKDTTKQIKAKVKAPDRYDWNNFVKSLEC